MDSDSNSDVDAPSTPHALGQQLLQPSTPIASHFTLHSPSHLQSTPNFRDSLIRLSHKLCTPLPLASIIIILIISITVISLHHSSSSSSPSSNSPNAYLGNSGIDPDELEALLGAASSPESIDLSSFKKQNGFFTVYQGSGFMKDRVLIGIPEELIDSAFIVSIIFTRGDASAALLHMQLQPEQNWFAFQMDHDRSEMQLYRPNYGIRIKSESELSVAFAEGVTSGVIARFPCTFQDNSWIIDATPWMMQGFFVLPTLPMLRPRLVSVKSYVRNVNFELDIMHLDDANVADISGRLQFSVVALPSNPMKTRQSDSRIGFFSESYLSLDTPRARHRRQDLIQHWRLKSNRKSKRNDEQNQDSSRKSSALDSLKVEDREEIVYYIDPSVPQRFQNAVKAGVEEWNVAFNKAGFGRNVIRAVSPSDANEWPDDYSPGDARYSTISWAPSLGMTFAIGPADIDPRTGEILQADIVFTHSWVRAWFEEYETLIDVTGSESGDGMSRVTREWSGGLHVDLSDWVPALSENEAALWLHGGDGRFEMNAEFQCILEAIQNNKDIKQWCDRTTPVASSSSPLLHSRHFIDSAQLDKSSLSLVRLQSSRLAYQELLSEYHNNSTDSFPALHISKRMWSERAVGKFRDFMYDALKAVVMHEVGHTLGLRHNFHGSANTPWEKLSDLAYVQQNGLTTSVMDYLPVVLRSDESMQSLYFTSTLGQYDIEAIRYGYQDVDSVQELKLIAENAVRSGLHYSPDEESIVEENPFAMAFDVSSSPLDFAKDQVKLVHKLLPQLYQRAVHFDLPMNEFTEDFSKLLQTSFRAIQSVTVFLGGTDFNRQSAKALDSGSNTSAAAAAAVIPISSSIQRQVLTFLIDVMDPINGLIGEEIVKEFQSKLVLEGGPNCDKGQTICFARAVLDPRSISRAIRFQLLMKISSTRLHNIQRTFLMLSSRDTQQQQQQQDDAPLSVSEVLRALTDSFLRPLRDLNGDEPARNWIRMEALSDWIDTLSVPIRYAHGMVGPSVLGEVKRIEYLVTELRDRATQQCPPSSTDSCKLETLRDGFQGILARIQYITVAATKDSK